MEENKWGDNISFILRLIFGILMLIVCGLIAINWFGLSIGELILAFCGISLISFGLVTWMKKIENKHELQRDKKTLNEVDKESKE